MAFVKHAIVALLLTVCFRACRAENRLGGSLFRSSRDLQVAAPNSFSASYVGEFQVLQDRFCLGPSPVLRAVCLQGTIALERTSDPTIGCVPDGSDALDCTNSCQGSACEEVYLTSDTIEEGPFGQVFFRCEGDELADVEATFRFEGNGDGGSCAAGGNQGRLFHVARMGVLCGSEYDFDDFFFECVGEDFVFPLHDLPGDERPGDSYTCTVGDNCDGTACDVSIGPMTMEAEYPMFQDLCVESSLPISPPTAPPTAGGGPRFDFSAQFEAAWGLLVDDAGGLCSGDKPTVRITCLIGNIEFIEAINGTSTCSPIGSDVLECSDTQDSFTNSPSVVRYECAGAPKVPTSMIEYPESDAFCNGNSQEATVRHAVYLGVFCDVISDYFFQDLYFECGARSNQFDRTDVLAPGLFRYTCFESALFQSGSAAAESQTLPHVSIYTDENWESFADSTCFDQNPVAPTAVAPTSSPVAQPTATPTAAPTGTPNISPVTEAPVGAAPSESPVTSSPSIPEITPTVPRPRGLPTPSPVIPPTPTEPSAGDGGMSPGVIIGGAVGGVALIAVAVFLAVYFGLKRRPPEERHGKQAATGGDHSHTGESQSGRHLLEPSVAVGEFSQPSTQAESLSAASAARPSPRKAPPPPPAVAAMPTARLSTPKPTRPRARAGDYVPDYKDQARSVMQVPVVSAVAVDTAVWDASHASANSGATSRSAEPTGEVMH